ncbi:MAG: TIGR03067 domain-containing protein [Phycisphaeraceae bacterium]
MRRSSILLVALFISTAAIAAEGEAQKRALTQLEGKWRVVKMTDGERDTTERDSNIIIAFKGNAIVVSHKDSEPVHGTITIDPEATPAQMDITLNVGEEKVAIQAVYEIKDDVFRLCHAQGANGKRPGKLEATKATIVAEFKREK